MGLFDGKKGLVFGIANDHSIAWAITQQLHAEGAEMGFTHLPDRDPERPRMERRLRKLVEPLDTKMIEACDVTNDEQLDHVFDVAASTYGNIDFMLHSIAYAPMDDLKGEVVDVSRDGFKLSMEISVYSLMTLTRRARPLLSSGGSILTLTYLGGEKVIPGYNVMGLCKSALESTTEYLASELGPEGIRVNALSPGFFPAEQNRKILLKNENNNLTVDAELLLMFAARAQHIKEIITPALNSGKIILCDRIIDASYAYQGGGRGIDASRINLLEKWMQSNLTPDVTLLFDLDVSIGMARSQKRRVPDRFEQEKNIFFEKVRVCYLKRAENEPDRFRIINSGLPLQKVEDEITAILRKLEC